MVLVLVYNLHMFLIILVMHEFMLSNVCAYYQVQYKSYYIRWRIFTYFITCQPITEHFFSENSFLYFLANHGLNLFLWLFTF